MITDPKSKTFLTAFAFLVMISIVVTYYRYVIVKDFEYYTDEAAFNQALEE